MRPLLTLAAVTTALVAALLLAAPPVRFCTGPGGASSRSGSTPAGRRSSRGRLSRAALVLFVALALGVGTLPATSLAALLVAAGAATVGAWLLRRLKAQRQAEERRRAVVDYCEALLGELRAGQPVSAAVERSVGAWPASHPVAAAARLGADVPTALRRLGAEPGASGLVRLAAMWELCAATGSGLAVGVERLLETSRAEQSLRRLVHSELASARATAWLVALLPLVVLVAAQGIGGRPWHFLLQTPAGVGCLAVGVALAATGLAWIDRIAERAVQGG